MLGSDGGIKLGSNDGNRLGTLIGCVDEITLGIDMRTYQEPLYGYYDGSNNGKIEGLLLGCLLRSTDGKVIVSDEGIQLILYDGEVLVTIHGDVDGIKLGIDIGTYQGSLDGS